MWINDIISDPRAAVAFKKSSALMLRLFRHEKLKEVCRKTKKSRSDLVCRSDLV